MFPRSYKVIPQTPTLPVDMTLYPSSAESTPKVGWLPPVARERDEYFVEDDYNSLRPPIPIVLEHKQADITRKIRIRSLRFIARLAATGVAIASAVQEGQTLHIYITTHNTQRNGRGPWAKNTQLWPSILLFSVSVIASLLGIAITIAYLISIKAANKVDGYQTKLSVGSEVAHVVVWIGVSIAYREGKNGKDLWGWACSPLAEKIQANFEGIVNFDKVCSRGGRQFGLSIANAVVNVFSGIILFMAWRRMKGKKELKRISTVYANA